MCSALLEVECALSGVRTVRRQSRHVSAGDRPERRSSRRLCRACVCVGSRPAPRTHFSIGAATDEAPAGAETRLARGPIELSFPACTCLSTGYEPNARGAALTWRARALCECGGRVYVVNGSSSHARLRSRRLGSRGSTRRRSVWTAWEYAQWSPRRAARRGLAVQPTKNGAHEDATTIDDRSAARRKTAKTRQGP